MVSRISTCGYRVIALGAGLPTHTPAETLYMKSLVFPCPEIRLIYDYYRAGKINAEAQRRLSTAERTSSYPLCAPPRPSRLCVKSLLNAVTERLGRRFAALRRFRSKNIRRTCETNCSIGTECGVSRWGHLNFSLFSKKLFASGCPHR